MPMKGQKRLCGCAYDWRISSERRLGTVPSTRSVQPAPTCGGKLETFMRVLRPRAPRAGLPDRSRRSSAGGLRQRREVGEHLLRVFLGIDIAIVLGDLALRIDQE